MQEINRSLYGQVYDIVLDAENNLLIVLYEVYLVTVLNNNQKYESYYTFEPKESYIPEDISLEINNLKNKGYLSSTKYENQMNLIVYTSFPNLKIAKDCKVLEKIYDEVIIDGVLYLVPYTLYIDMSTGERYLKRTGTKVPYDKLNYLTELGFINIINSSISKDLSLISKENKRTIKLT